MFFSNVLYMLFAGSWKSTNRDTMVKKNSHTPAIHTCMSWILSKIGSLCFVYESDHLNEYLSWLCCGLRFDCVVFVKVIPEDDVGKTVSEIQGLIIPIYNYSENTFLITNPDSINILSVGMYCSYVWGVGSAEFSWSKLFFWILQLYYQMWLWILL